MRTVWLLFAAIFIAVYFASLFSPPLLDDVDAAHAQAAQHMAETRRPDHAEDSTASATLKSRRCPTGWWRECTAIFGQNTFATHLPNALAMLGLTWLAWLWARRAWGERAGFYAGLGVLTSVGRFLFTRFIIPEAILAFFLLLALYALITGLEDEPAAALLLDVGGRGAGAADQGTDRAGVLFWRGHSLSAAHRAMAALEGAEAGLADCLLFLAIAAPWHILCGIINPDQGHPVGNHPTLGQRARVLLLLLHQRARAALLQPALSARLQQDAGHLVLAGAPGVDLPVEFVPAGRWWPWHGRRAARWLKHLRHDAGQTVDFYLDNAMREDVASYVLRVKFRVRTIWLLSLFSAWTLLFFSISTNQEYYTFPVWPPLLMLIAGVVADIEESRGAEGGKPVLSTAWLTGAQAVFAVIGVLAAAALGWGLWTSRNLPFVPDIGTLLAHRGVGDYTLSMSHLFDLTGASFAALRLPAALAAIALLIGPTGGLAAAAEGQAHGVDGERGADDDGVSSSPRTSRLRASSRCSARSNWPTPSCRRARPATRSSFTASSRRGRP